jgi:hypothetical protein
MNTASSHNIVLAHPLDSRKLADPPQRMNRSHLVYKLWDLDRALNLPMMSSSAKLGRTSNVRMKLLRSQSMPCNMNGICNMNTTTSPFNASGCIPTRTPPVDAINCVDHDDESIASDVSIDDLEWGDEALDFGDDNTYDCSHERGTDQRGDYERGDDYLLNQVGSHQDKTLNLANSFSFNPVGMDLARLSKVEWGLVPLENVVKVVPSIMNVVDHTLAANTAIPPSNSPQVHDVVYVRRPSTTNRRGIFSDPTLTRPKLQRHSLLDDPTLSINNNATRPAANHGFVVHGNSVFEAEEGFQDEYTTIGVLLKHTNTVNSLPGRPPLFPVFALQYPTGDEGPIGDDETLDKNVPSMEESDREYLLSWTTHEEVAW